MLLALLATDVVLSCKYCIVSYLTACGERNEDGYCPSCSRGPINETELIEVFRPKTDGMKTAPLLSGDDGVTGPATAPAVELRRNDFRSSTKLDALIQNLRESPFWSLDGR